MLMQAKKTIHKAILSGRIISKEETFLKMQMAHSVSTTNIEIVNQIQRLKMVKSHLNEGVLSSTLLLKNQ